MYSKCFDILKIYSSVIRGHVHYTIKAVKLENERECVVIGGHIHYAINAAKLENERECRNINYFTS